MNRSGAEKLKPEDLRRYEAARKRNVISLNDYRQRQSVRSKSGAVVTPNKAVMEGLARGILKGLEPLIHTAIAAHADNQELRREVLHLREAFAWHRYLSRIDDRVTPGQTAAIRQIWNRVEDELGAYPPLPMATRTDDGTLHVAWSREAWYLDVEIMTNGAVEWFFRDKAGTTAGTEGEPEPTLPEEFFSCLRDAATL